jgi:serine/threonine protein kinase
LNKILEEQTKLGDQLEYGDISCFFAQLLLAVDFLHAKNIFHSFINPK